MTAKVQKNVEFTSGSRPLSWDVYFPENGDGKLPVVVLLHGGGWVAGHRETMAAACNEYTKHGFVAIAVEYRLLGEAAWPAPLQDVEAAIEAIAEQSETLGIDPEQIFINGYSAGAHLAMLASAKTNSTVAAIASFFPIGVKVEGELCDILKASTDEQCKAASLLTNVSTLPPTIFFSGDCDDIASPDLTFELYQAAKAEDRTVDLRFYGKMIHEFVWIPAMMSATIDEAVAFFKREVIDKESFSNAALAHKKQWAEIIAATQKS